MLFTLPPAKLGKRLSRSFGSQIALIVVFCLLLVSGSACLHAQTLNPRWDPLLEPGCNGWSTGIEVSPFSGQSILVGGDVMGVALSTDAGWNWQQPTGFDNYDL